MVTYNRTRVPLFYQKRSLATSEERRRTTPASSSSYRDVSMACSKQSGRQKRRLLHSLRFIHNRIRCWWTFSMSWSGSCEACHKAAWPLWWLDWKGWSFKSSSADSLSQRKCACNGKHLLWQNYHRKQVEENRAILVPIVDTIILTCARQNIAFRRHSCDSGSISADGLEPGSKLLKFSVLVEVSHTERWHCYTTTCSNIFKDRNLSISRNPEWIDFYSWGFSQRSVICRIKEAKFWTLIADETADRHHREQTAIVMRYLRRGKDRTWKCY